MLDNLTRSPTETCANLEPSGQPSKHMEEPLSETPLATSSRLQRQVRALTQHFSVGFLDNARFFQPLSPPRQLFAVLALATSPPLLYAFDRVTLPARGLSCGRVETGTSIPSWKLSSTSHCRWATSYTSMSTIDEIAAAINSTYTYSYFVPDTTVVYDYSYIHTCT